MVWYRIATVLSLPILLGVAPPVCAHEIGSMFERQLIEADLVFEGQVTAVQYTLSEPGAAGRAALAHTFVTFRVDRLFKGSIADPTGAGSAPAAVTLRFLGGPEGGDTYLMAWGIPLFDTGDTDLLMVRGNGRAACPLVDCEHGRYRFIDRSVYNNFGHEVVSTAAAPVLYGAFHKIPEILENTVGPVVIGRGGEIEIDEDGLPRVLPAFGTHYAVESFRAVVEQTLSDLNNAGLLPPTDPVDSQDIRIAFHVDPAPPVARLPEVDDEVIVNAGGRFRSDRLEGLLTRDADDNPVLDPMTARILSQFLENELRVLGEQERRSDSRAAGRTDSGSE